MPMAEAFDALNKFWLWAAKYRIKTNESCGFHVGVSLPDHEKQPIDYLKLILLLGENYVLTKFGRETNEYTEPMLSKIKEKIKYFWTNDKEKSLRLLKNSIKNLAKETFMQNLVDTSDRHVAVNVHDNYIEFRAAGGNYLADKELIMNTIMRYIRAVSLAASGEGMDDYIKKLYKLLTNSNSPKKDAIYFFTRFVAGEIDSDALKYFIHQVQHIRKYNPSQEIDGGTDET
jgi:hemerythrin superfamily protein